MPTAICGHRRLALIFMNITQSALEECRYYLILTKDLGYGDTATLMGQLEEVSKPLGAYCRSILTPGLTWAFRFTWLEFSFY